MWGCGGRKRHVTDMRAHCLTGIDTSTAETVLDQVVNVLRRTLPNYGQTPIAGENFEN